MGLLDPSGTNSNHGAYYGGEIQISPCSAPQLAKSRIKLHCIPWDRDPESSNDVGATDHVSTKRTGEGAGELQ